MTCLACDRSRPADRGTGYDGDPLCPDCLDEGWSLTPQGQLLGPEDEIELPRPRMLRARSSDPTRLRFVS